MPELPEAETLRIYLENTSLCKTILDLEVRDQRILEKISSKELKQSLVGYQFLSVNRHGKRLFLKLRIDLWLTIHLGMSGWIQYSGIDESEPAHTRLLISFTNGHCLAYSDPRMFGRFGLTDNLRTLLREKKLGPDVLDINLQTFLKIMLGRKGAIKARLLDQSIIAGLGNLYADEALFQAGICPDARSIDVERLRLLFEWIHSVLQTAISVNSNLADLPESYLLSHRYPGGSCPLDGTALMRINIGGRMGYYCPSHQKR
jgi:formamidopyrimidine-DNA glycosylase